MAKSRILIVEDERGLTQSLSWYFNKEGYETHVADNGTEGLRKAQTILPDVVLLDIMLPGMNGLDVCRELRAGEHTRAIPIIMLTAKTEEMDQIVGYSLGADDYVSKPFSNKVLLAKVKALLRRSQTPGETGGLAEQRGLNIDRVHHRVMYNEATLDLTPTEFRFLELLARHPGRAFGRRQLLEAVQDGVIVLERTVDVHIRSIRRKLRGAGADELVETVRGVGYRLRDDLPS